MNFDSSRANHLFSIMWINITIISDIGLIYFCLITVDNKAFLFYTEKRTNEIRQYDKQNDLEISGERFLDSICILLIELFNSL